MKLWIARDEDGMLCIFGEEPYLVKLKGLGMVWQSDRAFTRIDEKAFPEVTLENSPQEVELKLVEK